MFLSAYLLAHREAFGIITLVLSISGFAIALLLWSFIRRSKKDLADGLKHAYLSDALLFLMTAGFGVVGALHVPPEVSIVIYCIRPAALLYSIWALFRLYFKFRKIGAEA